MGPRTILSPIADSPSSRRAHDRRSTLRTLVTQPYDHDEEFQSADLSLYSPHCSGGSTLNTASMIARLPAAGSTVVAS